MEILLLLLTSLQLACCLRRGYFNIGGVFQNDNYNSLRAFMSAINVKKTFDVDNVYRPDISIVPMNDVYNTTKTICNMTSSNDGIIGLFSPGHPSVNSIIQSISANLELPYFHVTWTPMSTTSSEFHLNFFPHNDLYIQGLSVIVKHLMWKDYVVLYENDESLVRLQDVIKVKKDLNPQGSGKKKETTVVTLKHLGSGDDYREVLKELKNTTDVNIILDCHVDNIIKVLQQAKEMNRLEHYHNYFLTSLDAHTLDYTILNTTANITSVRIVNMDRLVAVANNWNIFEINYNRSAIVNPKTIRTEEALTHDAVQLFLTAIRKLHVTEPIESISMRCDSGKKWRHGLMIVAYMKHLEFDDATTGPMAFDAEGRRTNFTLQVVERKQNNFQVTAKWWPELNDSLYYTATETEFEQQMEQDLQNMTLIVVSRIGPPYLRERQPKDDELLEGNNRYEGYSMDLIAAIAERLGFKFEFKIVKDYGKYNPVTKQWNGLIREILDRRAHLAICDLTITAERREAVDFSSPFMSLGISILYKKDVKQPPGLLSFMKPFSDDVWICTATIYLGVSIMLYFIARMAPGDWENPHPCNLEPDELENIWTLKNCMWLTLGSIMTQGCDILPKGISSRMVTSMWWFFAIIVVNSYMANLTAFLTADRMGPSIGSAEDLAKQTKIKYGIMADGSTEAFFRYSNFSTYKRMWTQMLSAKPKVFEKTNADGVNRVKTTKNNLYAFIMESSSIEYEVQKNCDLKRVGNWLDNKNYGIAMPMNFRYRSLINREILWLSENGKLKDLKTKWWKTKNPKNCVEIEESNKSGKIAVENVSGVFLVLGVGVTVALLIAILEFLWNVKNISVDEHISYWKALKHELQFALNIWQVKKRVKPQLSNSSANSSRSNFADTQSMMPEAMQGASSFLNLNSLNRIGLMDTKRQAQD